MNETEAQFEKVREEMCMRVARDMLSVFSGRGMHFTEEEIRRFAEPLIQYTQVWEIALEGTRLDVAVTLRTVMEQHMENWLHVQMPTGREL